MVVFTHCAKSLSKAVFFAATFLAVQAVAHSPQLADVGAAPDSGAWRRERAIAKRARLHSFAVSLGAPTPTDAADFLGAALPAAGLQRLSAGAVPGCEAERLAKALAKRTRWHAFQLQLYPLPRVFEVDLGVCPMDTSDASVAKRKWEKNSRAWLASRRVAHKALRG